jgi:copper chaperone CopZ
MSLPLGAKEVKTQIKIKGMTCASCATAVQQALTNIKGVKKAEVILQKNLAEITYDDTQASEKQLREAIQRTGFTAQD